MCGIIGYFGAKSPKKVILDGLKKLEYRGYDSSGVAILDKGKFSVYRASGKLTQLEKKIKEIPFDGPIGIGHTRWATHGLPTESNAHPHKVSGVSLVQNGIIENYAELKKELIQSGVKFSSETDTEVIVHLITHQMDRIKSQNQSITGSHKSKLSEEANSKQEMETKNSSSYLLTAVLTVLKKIEGSYCLLVLSEAEPDTLIAVKAGPPLILGLGEGELFLASDIQAFIEHTNQVVYLRDQEIVKIKKDQFEIFNTRGEKLPWKKESVNVSMVTSDKKGFRHYMLKEIFEQPRAVASALEPTVDLKTKTVDLSCLGPDGSSTPEPILEELKKVEKLYIVACGTSYYAGLYGKYIMESTAKIPVQVEFASEFRYRHPVLDPKAMVLCISQSGETADSLAALKLAKERGLRIMSLCNTPHSSIDRYSHIHLYMNSGLEVGVASTKAFLSSLAILNSLSMGLARFRGQMDREEETQAVETLLSIPSLMEGVLSYDSFFNQTSEVLKSYRGFLYLGRGHNYPIAMEGALKLKELAYLHAEAYPAGEMKHGPLALIDEKMIVVALCPRDHYYQKTLSNLEEVKARGGVIISIGTGQDEYLQSISEHYLSIPKCPWMLSGMLSVIPLQLLAYHLADTLGYNVDQPRNLAKSVTVE